MTETPVTETPATETAVERRKFDTVAVMATVLLGLLLGAVAWLLITPDPTPSDAASKPLAILSLPQAPSSDATIKPEPRAGLETPAVEDQPQPPPAPSLADLPTPAPQPPSEPEPPTSATVVALPPPASPTAPPAEPAPQRPAAVVAVPPQTPSIAQPPIPVPQPPAAVVAVPQTVPSETPPTPAELPSAAVANPAPPAPGVSTPDTPRPSVAVAPLPEPTINIPQPPAIQPVQRGIPVPAADGLAPAPDPSLVEDTRDGPLPMVGKDGRKPWQVYARPFDLNDKRPRVALIVSGLGLSTAATEIAIQRLPGGVTLAFAPYAKNLDQWIALARAAGHEVLLSVPMEPIGYPENDPGPHTLLTTLNDQDNRDRLLFLLSRFTGYVGVLNTMGAKLTTTPHSMKPILEELKTRGLIFVDARSSMRSIAATQATEIGLPRVINNRFIDIKAARSEIDQRLDELERIAREGGYALGIGSPYPVTIERVMIWAQELESKGIALAPVSALVDKQPD